MSAGMDWRRALRHRFVVVPAALAALVAGWNVYVSLHDDGIIAGTVHDRAGRPVAGATVVFYERNFVNYQEKQRATTDASGAYRFTDMRVHVGQLEAQLADGRRSARHQLRLWFRAQNVEVPPLVVEARGTGGSG